MKLNGIADRELARFIDHTLLGEDAPMEEIARICDEALKFRCAAACIPRHGVALAAARLKGSGVLTATVVGFPTGEEPTEVKAQQARAAAADWADELDMVMQVGWLKDGRDAEVAADIRAVVEAGRPAAVKVIIEMCLLNDEEKKRACLLAQQAGAAFVKTSTGLAGGGATVEDVALMRRTVGPAMGVKASGGIRDAAAARSMLAAGANRIGASATLAIIGQK